MNRSIPSISAKEFEILMICMRTRNTSTHTLSSKLKVTERTVRSYIKKLNDSIGEDIVRITHTKGKGYELVVKSPALFEEIIEQHRAEKPDFNIRDNRVNYILQLLLTTDDYMTLEDITEELHVSRTTVVNDFKIIKERLEEYGLTLYNRQNRGMILEGSEINKRLLLFNYVKETDEDLQQGRALWDTHRDRLAQGLSKISTHFDYLMTERVVDELLKHMKVVICRLSQQKFMDETDNKIVLLKSYKDCYEIAEEIKGMLEEVLDMEIPNAETAYFVIPFISSHAPFQTFQKMELNTDMLQLLEEILTEIEFELGIYIEDSDLKKGLGQHLMYALNRALFNIAVQNPILDEIKEEFALAFKMAQVLANVITKKYHLKISEEEIGHMALHFENYLEGHKNKLIGIKSIALICENALGIGKLLNTKLRRIVGEGVTIDTLSNRDIANVDLNEYDIVLSTIDLDKEIGKPLIKISPIFDENKLRKKINNALYLKKNSFAMYHHFQTVVSCIKDENFFMSLTENTLFENLDVMLQRLLELGHIDNTFMKRVISREEQSSTAIDNGILFPHAVNDTSTEITIAIGTLKTPVTINDKEIKVIILRIYPPDYEDSDLLVKVFEDVLKIGHQKKLINEIAQCQTLDDFKKVLQMSR